MSKENVELVRSIAEDFLSADFEFDAEGMITSVPGEECWDGDIEWDASRTGVPGLTSVCRGKEAVRQWWREWYAAWETIRFEYELVDAGDRVVLLADQRMRGRSTGIEVRPRKYAMVCTLRDGRIVYWKFYPGQSEALEAVGLRE
jgi:ketosteroid isomerase-like protein